MSVIFAYLVPLFVIPVVASAASAQECGVRKSLGRIVGGRDSGGYHYPWFALLVLKENTDFPVCAGALITPRHVLSAAHCFTIKPSTPKEALFDVIMGVYDRCNRNEPTRQAFSVSHVVVHEDYRQGEKFHDIALMTLDKQADFTVICLPFAGKGDATEPALLIGYGVTREGGRQTPCHMMEAEITKYSKEDCKKTDLPKRDIEEPTVLCAGNIRGGTDSCQGDSGGPLQTLAPNGRYVIAGIVSYGYGCANPGLPGVYTDVARYLNWIESRITVGKPASHSERRDKMRNSSSSSENGVKFPDDQPRTGDVQLPFGREREALEPRSNVRKRGDAVPLGYTERTVVFPRGGNTSTATGSKRTGRFGGTETVISFPKDRK